MAEQEPVLMVKRNASGQIYLTDANGSEFDMSQFVGQSFYAAPPQDSLDAKRWRWARETDLILEDHTPEEKDYYADAAMRGKEEAS